ncbi:hypothetical protein Tco_0467296 [Tanacetum coccineum]
MVVRKLTMIDMDKQVRLHIYEMLGDVETWLALGPERQQDEAAVRAAYVGPEVAEDGVQADPAPVEAAQVP